MKLNEPNQPNQPETLREKLTRLNGGKDVGEIWIELAITEKSPNRPMLSQGFNGVFSKLGPMPLQVVGIKHQATLFPIKIWHVFGEN